LPIQNYITSSCVISNNTVYKNDEVILANKSIDPTAFFLSIYQYLDNGYARFYKMDPLCKLAWLTSELLLKDGFQKENYQPEEIGLVLTNANASLDTDSKYLETTKDIASPSVFVYTLPNIMIGEISIRNHFKGESAFFVFEKFDAGFLEQYVNNLLNNDILQACICGWVELLGNEYKAVLYLVEKKNSTGGMLFTKQNIGSIFESEKR